MVTRKIPSTGEALPVIGLGTWKTFDVGPGAYPPLENILQEMRSAGSRLIDSSPMYGRSEEVVGELTSRLADPDAFFYATKVWTEGAESGKRQVEQSYKRMQRKKMDLVQIHNLVDWKTHLPYLRSLKEKGTLRYIGITHYQDSSHGALAEVIKKESPDFVQFNYSILSRHAEKFLLPLCAEKGVATLINRPFGEGSLFRKVAGKPLPPWAAELQVDNWGSFFLKFILANAAVTCAIPATSDTTHARQNLAAGGGPLPDRKMAEQMADYVESL